MELAKAFTSPFVGKAHARFMHNLKLDFNLRKNLCFQNNL
jgi:hypothetical protein